MTLVTLMTNVVVIVNVTAAKVTARRVAVCFIGVVALDLGQVKGMH